MLRTYICGPTAEGIVVQRLRLSRGWLVAVTCLLAGCHSDGADEAPLFARKISITDRFYDVAAIDADTAIVVGYGGKILRTADGGYTWDVIDSGSDKALYSVDFPDREHGWIAGQSGTLLHSSDGGKTWVKQQSPTPVYLFSIDMVNASEGWAVGDRATTLHTRDGGKTWQAGKLTSTEGLTPEQAVLAEDPVLYGVQFVDPATGWIVGEFGNIYFTADGGATWKTQQESLVGEGMYDALDIPTFFGVHFLDASNGVAAALEGRVARTRDGGKSWKYEEAAVKEPIVDPLLQPFQMPDTTGWAVGVAGEVLRQSTVGGAWERASLGMEVPTWLRGIDWFDAQNGWIVGGYGLILHTTDGGKSWVPSLG
ncbi:MAG: WD40/YVTN/BNR-like repeat-containing protein [Candidatus Binatia bacterium]